jgi:hypothetical protein
MSPSPSLDSHVALKALANPLRTFILRTLALQPMTVNQLQEFISFVGQPIISKHLAILREAGLVSFTATGVVHTYRANADALMETANFILDTADGSEPSAVSFDAYRKTPRLFREVVITEKLDGTNSAIIVTDDGQVAAQSRKRLITPGPNSDHYGFAAWVESNEVLLAEVLGEGRHFGEWWGGNAARKYGLDKTDMRFSLFDVDVYQEAPLGLVPGLGVVPVLARQIFTEALVRGAVEELRANGSRAVPGFMNPEGVIVRHTDSGQVYKVTLENDELPKGLVRR